MLNLPGCYLAHQFYFLFGDHIRQFIIKFRKSFFAALLVNSRHWAFALFSSSSSASGVWVHFQILPAHVRVSLSLSILDLNVVHKWQWAQLIILDPSNVVLLSQFIKWGEVAFVSCVTHIFGSLGIWAYLGSWAERNI